MAIVVLVATAVLSSGVTFLVTHYEAASQAAVAVPAPTEGAAPPVRVDRGARF